MEFTIKYSTEGKTIQTIKNDKRHLDRLIRKMTIDLSTENTPYDFHPVYWQLHELYELVSLELDQRLAEDKE